LIGTLRAAFNALYDNLQGFSICTTGQLFILQLIYDLQQISTLEMISANTDAVMYTVDEEYKEQAHKVLHDWETLTGLELEEDRIVKIVMRDVNNYAEIVQVGDNDFEVHYKGGELTRGDHNFKWNKEKKIFEYSFKDSLKSNSLSIVSEAILKFLLFDTPIEDTINNCNDIFRFQTISHLGSTYEKCVQESEKGDILLQRHNRIYASNVPRGTIVKVKPNGRRDSLANCPPNPIVDNANKCTIEDINKEWYIEFAQEKANDFLGIPRLESLKKEELLEKAKELNLDIDKKIKKDELIKLIKNKERSEVKIMATKQDVEKELEETKEALKETKDKLEKSVSQSEKLVERLKTSETLTLSDERANDTIKMNNHLYSKIDALRRFIRERDFVFDEELPSNLGGGEYYNIGQLYDAVQEGCLEVGLDFSFDTIEIISFDKELVKPSGKMPIHVATVRTKATLTDITTGNTKEYYTISQGSDTIDKAVSGATTLAFRHWFMKNFSPKGAKDDENTPTDTPKSEEPKTPTYIPETKKEELKKEVVTQSQEQKEESDDEDLKEICENIMKVREITGDNEYGIKALAKIQQGNLSDVDIEKMRQKTLAKLEEVSGENNG